MINKKIITTLAILVFNLSAINVAHAVNTAELKFGSGASYIGEVKRGKANGIGALKAADGTNYIGEFKRNIINGEGILIKLNAFGALADLKLNENFPQKNKNEIEDALNDFAERWVNLKRVDNQLNEDGLVAMKVEQQNLKKEFFEDTYPEWWAGALKKANNDEKLLLDNIQIFVGKWKWGSYTEYFGKDKKFRRRTKLKKLTEIGRGDEGNRNIPTLVNNIIPNINIVGRIPPDFVPDPPGGVTTTVNVTGGTTQTVTDMPWGPTTYTGDVVDTIPNGRGTFTHTTTGEIYSGDVLDGRPGGQGNISLADGGTLVGEFNQDGGRGNYRDPNGSNFDVIVEFTDDGKVEFVGGTGTVVNEVYTFEGTLTVVENSPILIGTFENVDGTTFTGTIVIATGKPLGGTTGTETFLDGSSYTGTYRPNGKPLEGTKTFPDGTKYTGTFMNRRPLTGALSFPDDSPDVSVVESEFSPIDITRVGRYPATVTPGTITPGPVGLDFLDPPPIAVSRTPENNDIIEICVLEVEEPDNKFYHAEIITIKYPPLTPISQIDPLDLQVAATNVENAAESGSGNESNQSLGFSHSLGGTNIGISEAGQMAADAAGSDGSGSSTATAGGSTGGDAGTGGDSAGGNDGGGMGGSP